MLKLNKVCKRFGNKTVADDICLTVGRGKILAVLGQSGCGKSTLLNMIAGIVRPDGGEIWLNGENITRMPPEKRRISLMFQDYALFPHMSALENAAFGLKMQKMPKAEAESLALSALAEVGLENEAHRKPEKLSGGEKQRLALARALVVRPSLLLLDESFSSLDTHLRDRLRRMTAERIRKGGIPAVLVTHSPEEACTAADEIAVMHEGKILQCGTPETLVKTPADAQVARLMGLPNTDDDRHIPQHAVRFDQDGMECRVLSRTCLPESFSLSVLHPKHGILWLNLDMRHAGAVSGKDTVRIHIEEREIVRFR
ncbi:ABC transporter ATP-binding protein [Neisseria meningitidis]|uniref:ABC transporter ATP-binding protein n=1 Tax=Neisseria meningitidis TaxID=487 RepID=UPI001C5A4AF1|nr:ABC transporter ATP-binding protein [Neisseria meningitidis]MBW4002660.1 ABC transporter ATP-binding protein [Neisseria meningitidis]